MLDWLFSRPLRIKFFVSTILLVSVALLLVMLNVLQVLNQVLSHHIEQDMQQRTHILAMALMSGPAAHDPGSLRIFLRDVVEMHGYCYLSVQDTKGKPLASAADDGGDRPALPAAVVGNGRNNCFNGSIPLIHEGK